MLQYLCLTIKCKERKQCGTKTSYGKNTQMKASLLVEKVLQNVPKARDSDRRLLIEVYQGLGLGLTSEQIYKFLDMPLPETIRRERQKFQEKGQYLGSPEVMRKRRIKSYEVQQNAPVVSPKRLGDIVEGVLPPTRPLKVEDIDLPSPHASTLADYIFKSNRYGIKYEKGQLYKLEIAKLEIGKPIRILGPYPLTYSDLAHFNKEWGVPK